METSKKAIKKTEQTDQNQNVEVLYQLIGGRWYAFSAVDDEVFYGTVPNEALDDPTFRQTGNS